MSLFRLSSVLASVIPRNKETGFRGKEQNPAGLSRWLQSTLLSAMGGAKVSQVRPIGPPAVALALG